MSTDILGITAYYSDKQKQNVFGIRGMGARYDSLWKWLNGGKSTARGVGDDFPWAYVVFDDPFQEQQFASIYADDFDTLESYVPLPPGQVPNGWVPHDQRIPGEEYLEKCGHYHKWDPKPEEWNLEDEVMSILTQNIADEIDAEILEELTKLTK